MKTKLYLCGEKGCCPSVEICGDMVNIGEQGNMCSLNKNQWNAMVDIIRSYRMDKI